MTLHAASVENVSAFQHNAREYLERHLYANATVFFSVIQCNSLFLLYCCSDLRLSIKFDQVLGVHILRLKHRFLPLKAYFLIRHTVWFQAWQAVRLACDSKAGASAVLDLATKIAILPKV